MSERHGIDAWFNTLFRPGELFEYRIKRSGETFAKSYWWPVDKLDHFVNVHLPLHNDNEMHVWVGVSPRAKVGDKAPTVLRALWCDFASYITDEGLAQAAIEAAELPPPTMLVNSGRGYHGYWALASELTAEQVRPYSKGLHAVLPTDNTHDPARVMRVPGNVNPRNGQVCRVTFHDPTRVYDHTLFPASQEPLMERIGQAPAGKELSSEDFELFAGAWLPGQIHNLSLGVVGYLRKNLGQSREQALKTVRTLHESTGNSWEDDNGLLQKVVEDTYAKPIATVSGTSRLAEYGVAPTVTSAFELRFVTPKPSKVKLIDFAKPIDPQEFWVDGLVGPGLLTIWAAEPKTGKSLAVMQIGHALANGLPLWDFDTTPERKAVLYFQGELSQGMVYDRARKMFEPGTYEDPKWFAMTDRPEKTLSLVETPEVLYDIADPYDVIIVDPLSVFSTNDENSVTSVRDTMALFDPLRSAGKAVILVHHLRKLETDRDGNPVPPSFSDLRGSSAVFAAVDAAAVQWRWGDNGNTKVKFMYRAAEERDVLSLYRDGLRFTTDRDRALKTQYPNFPWRTTVPSEVN